jgi:hypothetical protein
MPNIQGGLAALALILSIGSAQAEPIVDQSFVPPFLSSSTGVSLGFSLAQTFTVGVKGQLTSANVAIVGSPPVPCVTCFLEFEIRRTINGAPSNAPGDVLAQLLISTDALPRRPTLDLWRVAP